ncbi:MAG: dUTP diphosphatase [Shewanella sp.]
MNVKLNVKRITDTAKIPTYAHDGDACFDIYSDGLLSISGSTQVHETGLKFDIPKGYAMMIYSRSGMGFKDNTRLANCVGVVDSGYVGQVMVKLTRDDGCIHALEYKRGDRIAQAMLIPVPVVEFEEVDDVEDTERGDGGFGSSGK